MNCREHCNIKSAYKIKDLKLIADIQMVRWFIQHEEVTFLGHRTGYDYSLFLAARQIQVIAFLHICHTDMLQRMMYDFLILRSINIEQPLMRCAAHSYDLTYLKIKRNIIFLPYHCHFQCRLFEGHVSHVFPVDFNCSTVRFQRTVHIFQHRRFSAAIWSDQTHEFTWHDLYRHMIELKPFSQLEMDTIMNVFRDYMSLGGMPEVVKMYIDNGHFGGTLELQRQLLKDYEEDITKYAKQTDKAKLLAVYNHISTFLAKDNKKYQITKIAKGARNREYIGAVDWLKEAGVINVCYCLNNVELPLKGNYDSDYYKLYYHDTGLLIASLDEEAQEDLRANKNFGTYKGAIYENVVGEMLRKSGYDGLYFYKRESPALEMDFFVRDANSLVPVEVKAKDNATVSLNNLIKWNSYPDVKYGIKLGYKNIGWNGQFYTFPYFLTFLLKRFLKEQLNHNKTQTSL